MSWSDCFDGFHALRNLDLNDIPSPSMYVAAWNHLSSFPAISGTNYLWKQIFLEPAMFATRYFWILLTLKTAMSETSYLSNQQSIELVIFWNQLFLKIDISGLRFYGTHYVWN